jgi:uncharacterized repeat protein (TIGR01451 family)
MFGLGRKWPRRTAQLAAAGMLAASGSMFFASTALAVGGNNGTIKFGSAGQPFTNANDPHLTCPIQLQWDGFDPGTQTFTVTAATQAPTGGTMTITGAGTNGVPATFSAQPHTEQYSMTFAGGATPNNKGEYHVGITVNTTATGGASDTKNKTIWVTGCGPDLSMDKTGTAGPVKIGDPVSYTLTVTNVGSAPTTGTTTVTDALPAGLDPGTMVHTSGAGTWTCNNAPSQNPSCSSTSVLAAGAVATFTVSSVVSAGTADGTVTNSGTVANASDPNSGNNTDTQDTIIATPVNVSDLVLTAACNPAAAGQITWTVKNPAGNPTVDTLAVSNGAVLGATTLAANATTTFTTAAPQATALTVSGKTNPGAQNVSSNALSFAATCTNPGQPEVDATVTFDNDCTGITAHYTSADQHSTVFTVTEPMGGSSTFTGSGSKHYDADAAHAHIAVTDDKNHSFGSDWVDQSACHPTAADPQVAEANHCKSGMNLTLSNMNGTADVTFTVTKPDGSTQQVGVRAGQLKKLTFEVKEDTTGTLSVSAPGLAKKTFTYKKNCATVLGVKHTRKPPHKPVVEGEHAQLPFTGFDTRRALLDGAGLFFFGAVLCMLGARRKDEDYVY